MPPPRDPKAMDALHSSELEGLKQRLSEQSETMGGLHGRLLRLEEARIQQTLEVGRLTFIVDQSGERVGALIGLLRAMPLSAWPGLTAGAFADLWEGLEVP